MKKTAIFQRELAYYGTMCHATQNRENEDKEKKNGMMHKAPSIPSLQIEKVTGSRMLQEMVSSLQDSANSDA